MTRIKCSTIDPTDFVPFPAEEVELLEGDFHEMIHLVREGAAGLGDLQVGVSVTDRPSKVRYTFPGDHTVSVIFGEIDVELDDGEAVNLRAGDIASFPKGATCIWSVVRPTKEIFVMSG
jgi:ethanolamine utilization protein EutQ (cupin superfamily)